MSKEIVAFVLGMAAIVGATVYFTKRDNKIRAAAKAEHEKQMATNPAYAEAHRTAAAERAARVLEEERIYNSPEAVARRERERQIRMEEELYRLRQRNRYGCSCGCSDRCCH